jgi:ABC-type polysaccharide transport system permease subunit
MIKPALRKKDRIMLDVKRLKKHWQFYIIILLPLAHLLLFRYGPMYGIIIAFKRYNAVRGIFGSPWAGLRYFKQFFASSISWNIIWNTLHLSVYSLAVGFPFAIILAIALNECTSRAYKKTVQFITYAPYFISTVVLVGIILQITDLRLGVINTIIRLAGGEPVNFMGKAEWFPSIYVFSGVWQGAGFSSILYLAALSGVSPELHEAALIDGTNLVQRIWHVDLPYIRPTIVIQLILSLGNILNVGYEKVFLMQNDLNLSKSEIISTYVYKVGLQNANYSFSTAIGLMNTLVSFALIVLVNEAAKRFLDSSLW